MLTLEKLSLRPSTDPFPTPLTNIWFEYSGYFRKPAHCQLEVYTRPGGTPFHVVIATELENNDGTSITNAAEMLWARVCLTLKAKPESVVMIEHYGKDSVLEEHWSLVRFKESHRDKRDGWTLHGITWTHLEKSELERLLGRTV
jgi:hypothetical protein